MRCYRLEAGAPRGTQGGQAECGGAQDPSSEETFPSFRQASRALLPPLLPTRLKLPAHPSGASSKLYSVTGPS